MSILNLRCLRERYSLRGVSGIRLCASVFCEYPGIIYVRKMRDRREIRMFEFLKRKTIYRTHDPEEYQEALQMLQDNGFAVKTYVLDSDVPAGCG